MTREKSLGFVKPPNAQNPLYEISIVYVLVTDKYTFLFKKGYIIGNKKEGHLIPLIIPVYNGHYLIPAIALSSALIRFAVSPRHVLAFERKYSTMLFPESIPYGSVILSILDIASR